MIGHNWVILFGFRDLFYRVARIITTLSCIYLLQKALHCIHITHNLDL